MTFKPIMAYMYINALSQQIHQLTPKKHNFVGVLNVFKASELTSSGVGLTKKQMNTSCRKHYIEHNYACIIVYNKYIKPKTQNLYDEQHWLYLADFQLIYVFVCLMKANINIYSLHSMMDSQGCFE